jgi:hypothetical protein
MDTAAIGALFGSQDWWGSSAQILRHSLFKTNRGRRHTERCPRGGANRLSDARPIVLGRTAIGRVVRGTIC